MANPAKIFRNLTCITHHLRCVPNEVNRITTVKGTYTYILPTRSFKLHIFLLSEQKFTRDPTKMVKKDGTVIRKKGVENLKIKLLKGSEITVMPMGSALSLAQAHGLNLIKVENKYKAANRDTYKLVSDSELAKIKSEEKSKDGRDELKNVLIRSAISDHDLKIKIQSILRLLNKNGQMKCSFKKINQNDKLDQLLERVKDELKKEVAKLSITPLRSSNVMMEVIMKVEMDEEKNSGKNDKS